MKKCLRIVITGKVQHVGFRYFTQKEATKYGVKGWVKNEPDGSVVVEVEGEEPYIDAFILVLRNGPGWARIDKITEQKLPVQNFKNFEVKYSL